MVQSDRSCLDVLTQVAAVTHALQSVALTLLDDQLRYAVIDGAQEHDDKVGEATAAIARLVRC